MLSLSDHYPLEAIMKMFKNSRRSFKMYFCLFSHRWFMSQESWHRIILNFQENYNFLESTNFYTGTAGQDGDIPEECKFIVDGSDYSASFSYEQCDTQIQLEAEFLVYTNKVSYKRKRVKNEKFQKKIFHFLSFLNLQINSRKNV